jgi:SagB-type dehydrogenase family enzyme
MFAVKSITRKSKAHEEKTKSTISLPKPNHSGEVSIEEALSKRRSVRDYKNEALQLKEISQLLWAAQGITGEEGKRTAPSAGAFYPLEIYLVAATIDGLVPGIYHYRPADHSLQKIAEGDKRRQLSAAALMQGSVRHCAAIIVFAAHFNRITKKYFERGKYYGYIETGHAAQNILLQAIPLRVGVVTVGAFIEGVAKKILHLPGNENPLYLLPLGKI